MIPHYKLPPVSITTPPKPRTVHPGHNRERPLAELSQDRPGVAKGHDVRDWFRRPHRLNYHR